MTAVIKFGLLRTRRRKNSINELRYIHIRYNVMNQEHFVDKEQFLENLVSASNLIEERRSRVDSTILTPVSAALKARLNFNSGTNTVISPVKTIVLGNLKFEVTSEGGIVMTQITDTPTITQITSNSISGDIRVQHTNIKNPRPPTEDEQSKLDGLSQITRKKWYHFWK